MIPVIDSLYEINCPSKEVNAVIEFFDGNMYDLGYTYTNPENHKSVVIIGPTADAMEFQDTFDHEKGHLTTTIADALDIPLRSEACEYLRGEIGKQMFKVAQIFLCDVCRKDLTD